MTRFFARYPATATLSALWILVFAMTAWDQAAVEGGRIHIDEISPLITHRFGDMRPVEIAKGQIWRALTATLLHYSVIHLVVNLVGLIQLGRMIEEWYGSAQAFLIYIVIGLGGNLIAAGTKLAFLGRIPANWGLVRSWLGRSPDVPSVGGSVVVCGLVGLIAVVGWRSRTRFGNFVKGQMVAILAFTALLGLVVPILDNLGHAGGAIVGAALGLLHKRLIGPAERPPARRWAGLVATAILIGAVTAQAQAQRLEPPPDLGPLASLAPEPSRPPLRSPGIEFQRRQVMRIYLQNLDATYRLLAWRRPAEPDAPRRAFARWAHRAGVPTQKTAITPPWPDAPEPLTIPDRDRPALALQALQIVAALGQLDPPSGETPEAEGYRDLLAVVDRACFLAPTRHDVLRFRADLQAVATWAEGRARDAAIALKRQAATAEEEPPAPE